MCKFNNIPSQHLGIFNSCEAATCRQILLLGLFLKTRVFEDHFVNFYHLQFSDIKS